jgi:hypothetical protein
MSADNPEGSNASEGALQDILSCIFALLSFRPRARIQHLVCDK